MTNNVAANKIKELASLQEKYPFVQASTSHSRRKQYHRQNHLII